MGSAERRVEVVYCPAAGPAYGTVSKLEAGATVQDALDASGLILAHPECAGLDCGVWGRRVGRDTVLHDGDRVEVYRPLQIDPKEARRQRARKPIDSMKESGKSIG